MPGLRLALIGFSIAVLCVLPAFAGVLEIDIDVAPNVLNIQNNGSIVTVHTNLPFGDVVAGGVELNGIDINSWKVDNRGYFVAKFLIDELKTLDGLRIDEINTLSLTGVLTDGTAFIGSSEIMVIDVVPEKKGNSR